MKILAHKDLGKKHAIIVVILLDNDLIFTGSLRRNSENIEIAVKKGELDVYTAAYLSHVHAFTLTVAGIKFFKKNITDALDNY